MEQLKKSGCVGLATILLLSLSVRAVPLSSDENLDGDTIFPSNNVTSDGRVVPVFINRENSENPPLNFPETMMNSTGKVPIGSDHIFPQKMVSNGPVVLLPQHLLHKDDNPPDHALVFVKASIDHGTSKLMPKDSDYYGEESSEESDISDTVEEIQADDKLPQKDNLEENYKSETNKLPRLPVNDYDDNTEVDHPITLQNTHILGIIGAALAVLCVCLYLGITVWRRIMFNRYGMRERLINEDDFYSNKNVHQNF